MSHWVVGKTKISDKGLLEEVAASMGLKVKHVGEMHGDYAGSINCEFVVADGKGGELAVVKGSNGDYYIQMDNYYNSICDIVGEDATLLTREYQTELHKREAQLMGGVIVSQEVDSSGYVFLEVSI
jgi:hypothetical protein